MKIQVLFDTDVLVDFFHNQNYAKTLFSTLTTTEAVHISVLTIAELRAGFTEAQASFYLPQLHKLVTIDGVSYEIAEYAGSLRFLYAAKGRSLPTIDALIAATAIVNNYQLATRNKKDFPMTEIRFYESST